METQSGGPLLLVVGSDFLCPPGEGVETSWRATKSLLVCSSIMWMVRTVGDEKPFCCFIKLVQEGGHVTGCHGQIGCSTRIWNFIHLFEAWKLNLYEHLGSIKVAEDGGMIGWFQCGPSWPSYLWPCAILVNNNTVNSYITELVICSPSA